MAVNEQQKQLFGWVYTAMSILGVQHGDGKHQAILTDKQQAAAHFWTILGFAPAIMSFGFPKLAVVALLTRLLNPGRAHLWFLWAMAAMTQVNLIVNMALLYTQCLPTASMWDASIPDKYCRDGQILVGYALYAACAWAPLPRTREIRSSPSARLLGRRRLLPRGVPCECTLPTANVDEEEAGPECCAELWFHVGSPIVRCEPDVC